MAGIVFGVGVSSFARIPLLPEIAHDLQLTTADIGLVVGAFGLGRVVADLPAGRIAHGGAVTTGFAVAGLTLALSTFGLALSTTLAAALVASMATGVASAITNTLGMFSFAAASAPARRGAAMAAYSTALMAGMTLGPAFGGLLAAWLGWRPAMWIAGGVGLVVAALCARRRPRHAARPDGEAAPDADARAAAEAGRERRRTPPGAGRLELALLATVPLVGFLAYASLVQTLVPIIGDEQLLLSPSTVGLTIAIAGSTRFVSAWVTGFVSDRVSRKVVLLPTLVCTAAAGLLLAFPGRWPWVAAIVLLGFGSSAISVAAAALADRVAPAALGRQMAIFRLTGDVGLLVGPVVAAVLYSRAGAAVAASAVAAAVAACAVATAGEMRRNPPHAT